MMTQTIRNHIAAVFARVPVVLVPIALAFVLALALPTRVFAEDLCTRETCQDSSHIHITNVDNFIAAILATRGDDGEQYAGKTVILDNDIDLTGDDVDAIIKQLGSLTFNHINHPFLGEFDGRGHTITGLDYHRSLWVPRANTGLFAHTKGAYIHDINFNGGYVGADFRGGYIVGLAEDTVIEGVKIVNCVSSVTPANNAVTLITNAGLAGGLIAGQTKGGVIYNCEVRGGSVVNNSTQGVTALGGEGLYIGALVGTADGTTIEYCRVLPYENEDGTLAYTSVNNSYDTAVGALGGQKIYVGGVVGGIWNGSQVIDCFSTANCYAYSGTYVSVGSGNISYAGGIAARSVGSSSNAAETNYITRCHFAGQVHTKQYNAAVVVPIIQHDVNVAGIVERMTDGEVVVEDSYFDYAATQDLHEGRTINAVGDHASGASYGPADDHYTDRVWWEDQGFDFEGDIARTSAYDKAMGTKGHINKWVMDYNLDMPVHGKSVKATLDYPGAGSVTIGTTGLATSEDDVQTTTSPYDFAVQGALPSDTALTITTTKNEDRNSAAYANVHDASNAGFLFRGWYLQKNVGVNHIEKSRAYFDKILGTNGATATGEQVGTDDTLTRTNNGDGVWDRDGKGYDDNHLFVAYYQAQVLFHDVKGTQIDTTGVASTDTSDDWYDHEAALPEVPEPAADKTQNGVDADATFLGWTTMPSANGGGYAAVTSTELQAIKNAGALYQAGDAIEGPMDLYPVYASYASNIIVQFEGNELDSVDDATMRENVGATSVSKTDAGYVITAGEKQADGSVKAGAFPDGYRFRGWYHVVDGKERKVSADPTYAIPASVDLTQQQTYIARLEYRVDYYANTKDTDKVDGKYQYWKFLSEWVPYEWAFTKDHADAVKPEDYSHRITHWSTDKKDDGECSDSTDALTDPFTVTEPLSVYGHWDTKSALNIVLKSDFPAAGALSYDKGLLALTVKTTVNDGYRFVGWAAQGGNIGWKDQSTSAEWRTTGGFDTGAYVYEAHLAAQLTFHDAKGDAIASPLDTTKTYVERLYGEKVLSDAAQTKEYVYPADGTTKTGMTHTSAASPTAASMAIAGTDSTAYTFLGWIDKNAIVAGEMTQDEWDYVFSGDADDVCSYLTTDPARATPYLVGDADTVTRAMDLYPVYVKHAVSATTNIKRAGVTASSGLNVPVDPTVALGDAGSAKNGYARTVTLEADAATRLSNDSSEVYKLTSWTVERSDGVTETVTMAGGAAVSNDNATLTYEMLPGYTYTFVANYQPLAVVYHTNTDETKVVVKNDGDALGAAPAAAFDISQIDAAESTADAAKTHLFVGWTTTAPTETTRDYALWRDGGTDGPALVSETTVVRSSMELWPVYRPATVTVNSNIDAQLPSLGFTDLTQVRSLKRVGDDGSRAALSASAADVAGYQFVGWYEGYVNDAERGTLVSASDTYTLSANEPFGATTYTAVYQKVYDVRYHGTDGSVLYTVKVKAGDNRSFVQTVDDGTGKQVETMIDYEPYQVLVNKLDAANTADGATTFESFAAWQWVMDNGIAIPWDTFKGQTITKDMDLYPVIWQLSATDASSGNYTSKLSWQLASDPATADEGLRVGFKELYTQGKLTVHINKVSYAPAEVGTGIITDPIEATSEAINGVKVGLYDSPIIGDGGTANRIDVETTGDGSFGDGNAVFTFENAGTLTISKTAPAKAAGSVVSFTITECEDETGKVADTARSITVSCVLKANADATAATGTVTVHAPFGYYKVEETAWAWRNTPSYTMQDRLTGTWSAGNVATVFTKGEVKIENTVKNDKWASGEVRSENIFSTSGAPASAAESVKGGEE